MPPWGAKFFQFHAVFWENLAKLYVGPRRVGAGTSGEILDPPLENDPIDIFCSLQVWIQDIPRRGGARF